MKEGGKGGANTGSGLHFEKKTDLAVALKNSGIYDVREQIAQYGKPPPKVPTVTKSEEPIAVLCAKHKLYKHFLVPHGIDVSSLLSKKLLPDEAIFSYRTRVLTILEKKFQKKEGSVDEKLQTCDFKIKQYRKLVSSLDVEVQFIFVLNEAFWGRDAYNDVRAYVRDVNCDWVYDELPLSKLRLEE